MMKKIISIGLLLCFLSACGVTNSKKSYHLKIHIKGKGSVDQKVIPASSMKSNKTGTVIELTAKPDSGWFFQKWEGDITGTDNPVTITVKGAKEVTAVFEKKYNPHLDGFYSVKERFHNGTIVLPTYLYIQYPYLHVCTSSYPYRDPSSITWLSNVYVKVVHVKENLYKAQIINGIPVSKNITYKMHKDNVGLHFREFIGGKFNGVTIVNPDGNSPGQSYYKCLNHTNETRLIFQPL